MPTLNEVIRLIAQRGGFLARKGDGEPGAKTLWLGLQEIAILWKVPATPESSVKWGLVYNGMGLSNQITGFPYVCIIYICRILHIYFM